MAIQIIHNSVGICNSHRFASPLKKGTMELLNKEQKADG